MAKVKIDWNLPAFEEIRRLPAVEQEIGRMVSRTESAASQSSPGYEGVVEDGGDRVRGAVYTRTHEAIEDNARNNTLLKSLRGGQS